MAVIEDLLHGFGSIINGIFGVIQAILNGLVQLVQNIIFAFVTFFTSIISVVVGLVTTIFQFVWTHIAFIIVAAIGYFVYTAYVAPQRSNSSRKVGTKKRY